jgi:hypothetical protein
MSTLFPHPRRIVTGHDPSTTNAIFLADTEVPCVPIPGANCNFGVLYETYQFPASNDEPWEDPILQKTKSLANADGVVMRVVDFEANTKTVCILPFFSPSLVFV